MVCHPVWEQVGHLSLCSTLVSSLSETLKDIKESVFSCLTHVFPCVRAGPRWWEVCFSASLTPDGSQPSSSNQRSKEHQRRWRRQQPVEGSSGLLGEGCWKPCCDRKDSWRFSWCCSNRCKGDHQHACHQHVQRCGYCGGCAQKQQRRVPGFCNFVSQRSGSRRRKNGCCSLG